MPATIEEWISNKGPARRLVKFDGSHWLIPYYNLAYKRAYDLGIIDEDEYVHEYMCKTYGEDEFYEMLNYFVNRPVQKIFITSNTPTTPKPQDELTFTKYHYGMLTFSTLTANNYTGDDKQTEQEAIDYLNKIYHLHFNPQSKTYKGFNVNAWIEKIVSSNYIHMHVFYQRKENWLFVGSGFLKHGIDARSKKPRPIAHNVHGKLYKTDANILNAFNYQYNDSDSIVIKKFENQIKNLN